MEVVTDTGSAAATINYPSATATDNAGQPTIQCSPDSPTLEIGDNTITCTASDTDGNDDTCTYIITVVGKAYHRAHPRCVGGLVLRTNPLLLLRFYHFQFFL